MKRGGFVVIAPAIVVALVAIALLVKPHHAALRNGDADVVVSGTALVIRANSSQETVTDSVRLHSGDRLEVQRGTAHVTTSKAEFDARSAVAPNADSKLLMGSTPQLLAGELLIEGSHGAAVEAGNTSISVGNNGQPSVARVSRTLALDISVYQGQATVNSSGSRLTVPRLRFAEVVQDGDVSQSLQAIKATPTDAWDRKYLEPAIVVDQGLNPLIAGLQNASGQGTSSITPASLEVDRLPTTSDAHLQGLIDQATLIDPGINKPQAVIGAAIATLGKADNFESRWSEVFRFHSQRASWGIVAMDQDVGTDALLARVTAAVNGVRNLPFEATTASAAGVAPGPPVVSGPPTTQASGTVSGATPAAGPTAPAAAQRAAPTPTTRPGLVTLPTLPSIPSLISPDSSGTTPLQSVVDSATSLLSGLLNAISGPSGLLR